MKAQEKKKAKGKGKKGSDDEYEEEDDPYTSLSKSMWTTSSKPPVGDFETCAKCEKQFTVVCLLVVVSWSMDSRLCRRSTPWLRTQAQAAFATFAPRRRAKTPSRSQLHPGSVRLQVTSERLSTSSRIVSQPL